MFGVFLGVSGFSVSCISGSERVLSPSAEAVLDTVRRKANKHYPSLMPTLCPLQLATDKVPFVSIDAMWFSFEALLTIKTPAINGNQYPTAVLLASGAALTPCVHSVSVSSSGVAGAWSASLASVRSVVSVLVMWVVVVVVL